MRDSASKNNRPLVSVVMPAYNAEPFVEESVRSVIGQTVQDWELFVVDDCSTDNTYRVAEAAAANDPRITVLRNEVNSGVSRTRNRGLELCSGRYVAFLDSDDAWYPEKLARQIRLLEESGADLGYCSYALVDEFGEKNRGDYLVPASVDYNYILKENVILCSAIILTERAAREYRFNTEYYHEDFLLCLDILKDGYTAAGCTEVLLNWRYIQNTRSFNKCNSARKRWEIYRKYLDMSVLKSGWVFVNYAIAGFRKYFHKV